ncbi:MAG: hypothetical protein HQ503_07935 [Rhodospirillales bacterium]|nr:hypothetical protein [Rhodospirillales bacterium]
MSENKFRGGVFPVVSTMLGRKAQPYGAGKVLRGVDFPGASVPPRFGASRIILRAENFPGSDLVQRTAAAAPDFADLQDSIFYSIDAASRADAEFSLALDQTRAGIGDDPAAIPEGLMDAHLSALNQRRAEAIEGAPNEAAKARVSELFDGLIARQMDKALLVETEARQAARLAGAEAALGRIKARALSDPSELELRILDGRDLLGQMIETGISGNSAAARAEAFEAETRLAVLQDLSGRDPAGALDHLDGGAFNILFEDESQKTHIRDGLIDWAAKQSVEGERAAETERRARQTQTAKNIAQGLADGSADHVHIDLALATGAIDQAAAEDLNNHHIKTQIRAAQLSALDQLVKGAGDSQISSGDSQIPVDVIPAQIVDLWWTQTAARNSAAALQNLPALIGQTGIVPNPLIDSIRAVILGIEAEDKVAAGNQLRALAQISPGIADHVLRALPPKEALAVRALAEFSHLPMPAEQILSLAETQATKRQAAYDARRQAG